MKRILIIAIFLACTGQCFGQDAAQMPNHCTKAANIGTLTSPSWNGWGADLSNTRFQAERLSVSARTVGSHVEHVYAKIGVSTRGAAAMFAMRHGLADSRADG